MISSKSIRQVKSFKYLDVYFKSSTCKSIHARELLARIQKASLAITKFADQSGNNDLSEVIKLCKIKIPGMMLYSARMYLQGGLLN